MDLAVLFLYGISAIVDEPGGLKVRASTSSHAHTHTWKHIRMHTHTHTHGNACTETHAHTLTQLYIDASLQHIVLRYRVFWCIPFHKKKINNTLFIWTFSLSKMPLFSIVWAELATSKQAKQ